MNPITFAIDENASVVRVTYHGPSTFNDWVAVMQAVFGAEMYRPGFGFLVDRRNVPPAETMLIEDMIAFIGRHEQECRNSHWAIVVGSTADFGMARMTQALATDQHTTLAVFYDLDAGEKWLADTLR